MTFPWDNAETQGFSLGRATQITVSPDGVRVVFLRTRGGRDRARCLWTYDVATGVERLIVDPSVLVEGAAVPSAEERARRERARDRSAGVSVYATDDGVTMAAFGLSGRLWVADLDSGDVRELPASTPVIDVRPNPVGDAIAYLSQGAMRVIGRDGTGDRTVVEPDGPEVTFGLAEHEAAESMGRSRGYWWAPDGDRLVVARVDNSAVATWYLTNPTEPTAEPIALQYPAAGEANAEVSLWIVGLDGSRGEIQWDRKAYEYVTAVCWDRTALLVCVQNRAQTSLRMLSVESESGQTEVIHEDTDDFWVALVPGVPAHTASGARVWSVDDGDTRRLTIDEMPVTPVGLQLREVVDVDGDSVLFLASSEPADVQLWAWGRDGLRQLSDRPGMHDGVRGAGTTVVLGLNLDQASARVTVHADGHPPRELASHAETPSIVPRVEFLRTGDRELPTAVLYPTGHTPGAAQLPVLLDPYGGPAAQRVLYAQAAFLVSQWFADQGFIVVVADGRGTPGLGPRWERSIYGDWLTGKIDDQIDALQSVARTHPDLDLSRVGIRGWSAGGTLAAAAVLRRPDVFHAAVAGAPVTDFRLYSSHWQEQYYGDPHRHPETYDGQSLIADAPGLRRPLMLIHGLLDDNVHPAHTMRLSAALLEAGRPHTVLPLPAASHMTSATATTANLLLLQARFLLDSLTPAREIL